MTKDDEQLLKKRKKKFDIREEYYVSMSVSVIVVLYNDNVV